jgi:hypothetical protein
MIGDFCSVIQLLATIAIGFVLLGYTELFQEILKKHYFQADKIVSDACGDCRKRLIPESLLNDLTPMLIGSKNKDTGPKINKLKEEQLRLKEKIDDCESTWTKDMNDAGIERSMMATCLFVFLSSVLLLFVPVAHCNYETYVELFLIPFCSLSTLYLITSWIPCWKKSRLIIARFDSLRHAVFCFFVFIILSVLFVLALSLFWHFDFGELWKFLIVILVIFGWLNFIIHAFIIWHPIAGVKKKINKEKLAIFHQCDKSSQSYSFLIRVRDFAEEIDDDNGWRSTELQ